MIVKIQVRQGIRWKRGEWRNLQVRSGVESQRMRLKRSRVEEL